MYKVVTVVAPQKVFFIERVEVTKNGQITALPDLLTHHQDLADELHVKDRVHTYGRFYIADLAA